MTMTQQQYAIKILDAIQDEQEQLRNFNMASWVVSAGALVVPGEQLDCGTTMCVAGWACYLAGWTLNPYTDLASKDGETHDIQGLAAKLLDLDTESLFFTENEVAVAILKRMAAGETYDAEMYGEEHNRWAEANGYA